MIRILFLSANPNNADTLLAGDELRQIETALKGSRFEVIAKPAARLEDLPDLLRQSKASIVHFSGHGSRYGELMFVNEQGESQSASISALAKLFALFKGQVRCVVLNACYSDEQAAAIAEQVECVLGFEGAIRDDAARAFASGFYGALAAGETLVRAKDFGLNEIERRYPDVLLPCHLVGQGDANRMRPLDWDEIDDNQPLPTYNTAGGAATGRDVNTGGDFVNRDKIEGDKVEGDKHIHYHFYHLPTEYKDDKLMEVQEDDRFWRELTNVVITLYPRGPEEQHVWKRAGGDLSMLSLSLPGKTIWISAIDLLRKGGGGKAISLTSLLNVIQDDYPKNPEVLKLSNVVNN